MAAPDFQSLLQTTLNVLAEGNEFSLSELRSRIAIVLKLTPEDIQEMQPSGREPKFTNRIRSAAIRLEAAGLAERVRRGVFRLTTEGKAVLADPPPRIDLKYLRKYPEYANRRSGNTLQPSSKNEVSATQSTDFLDTPEKALGKAARLLRKSIETEVLSRVRDSEPKLLEKVVVDLLIAMGYDGVKAVMVQLTGRSRDGGMDGTIQEDALGLNEVYVRAKTYENSGAVGEGDLRNFAGAIDAAGTTKGVFITTASFTSAARNYVERSPKRIILIDGAELARLMVHHGIGVRTLVRYEVKRVDEDYFDLENAVV